MEIYPQSSSLVHGTFDSQDSPYLHAQRVVPGYPFDPSSLQTQDYFSDLTIQTDSTAAMFAVSQAPTCLCCVRTIIQRHEINNINIIADSYLAAFVRD